MCQYHEDIEYDYYRPVCRKCEETEQKFDLAQGFLESLVEKLYSTQDLDLLTFENHLDELCHYLGVNIGKGELQINRTLRS